jgi:hypothetical protein
MRLSAFSREGLNEVVFSKTLESSGRALRALLSVSFLRSRSEQGELTRILKFMAG